ncbi:MAG: hypothetical protein J6P44_02395 [Bacteroidales bacterium]|nr:hypothetical protein [Bacteroidales bacterium]
MTILEALKAKVSYPLTEDTLNLLLIQRELNNDDEFDASVAKSNAFQGAVADLYMQLATVPNMSEGGMSVSFNDASRFISLANKIYKNIGEEENVTDDCYTNFVGYKDVK